MSLSEKTLADSDDGRNSPTILVFSRKVDLSSSWLVSELTDPVAASKL